MIWQWHTLRLCLKSITNTRFATSGPDRRLSRLTLDPSDAWTQLAPSMAQMAACLSPPALRLLRYWSQDMARTFSLFCVFVEQICKTSCPLLSFVPRRQNWVSSSSSLPQRCARVSLPKRKQDCGRRPIKGESAQRGGGGNSGGNNSGSSGGNSSGGGGADTPVGGRLHKRRERADGLSYDSPKGGGGQQQQRERETLPFAQLCTHTHCSLRGKEGEGDQSFAQDRDRCENRAGRGRNKGRKRQGEICQMLAGDKGDSSMSSAPLTKWFRRNIKLIFYFGWGDSFRANVISASCASPSLSYPFPAFPAIPFILVSLSLSPLCTGCSWLLSHHILLLLLLREAITEFLKGRRERKIEFPYFSEAALPPSMPYPASLLSSRREASLVRYRWGHTVEGCLTSISNAGNGARPVFVIMMQYTYQLCRKKPLPILGCVMRAVYFLIVFME